MAKGVSNSFSENIGALNKKLQLAISSSGRFLGVEFVAEEVS